MNYKAMSLVAVFFSLQTNDGRASANLTESEEFYRILLIKDSDEAKREVESKFKQIDPAWRDAQEQPEKQLLWAAYAGRWSEFNKNLTALKLVSKIRDTLELASVTSNNAIASQAHCGLASLYLETPRFISIGSKRKAKEHIEIALKKQINIDVLLSYAKILLQEDNIPAAQKVVQDARTKYSSENFQNESFKAQWVKQEIEKFEKELKL